MKYIYLAKKYTLVVGDRFELFYRGVIKLFNPYQYYILVKAPLGNPYPRYFTCTPTINDIGIHELTIQLIDNDNNIVDEAHTTLEVVSPQKPSRKLNILCFGDSLTVNGVWPKEGYRRVCLGGGSPNGLGYGDILNFMGTCMTTEDDHKIGYEGYGGWTWKSYVSNDHIGLSSSVWIYAKHDKDESDQHSVWECNGHLWILETIEKDRLKFKRGPNNISMVSNLGTKFTHVSNAVHQDMIVIEKSEFEKVNPFWSVSKNDIDFKEYIEKNHFETPDLIYILLTWNGLYIPYNHDFSHHLEPARKLLRNIHNSFPKAKITLLGIQICSVNGGIASNYGAHGPYSDTFGTISSAFNYNAQLEAMCYEDEFASFVSYVDTKAQFDSEYNMPSTPVKVNARCEKTEQIGTNGVHPNMDGYLQIGDAFYRKLILDIKDL